MVTAALLLTSTEYTTSFAKEAQVLVKTALKELSVLVDEITKIAAHKLGSGEKKEEDLPKSEKDAVTSQAGRIWDACDSITTLVTQGVVGHVVRRVQEWHDLVKDAISELEEWDPEEDDADFEELLDDDDDGKDFNVKSETNNRKKKSLTQGGEAAEEEEDYDNIKALRAQKKALLRALKPIAQIYPAIISNRIKKGGLTATISQIAKLESLSSDLSSIPSHVDEAAGSLYESNIDDSIYYLKLAKSTAERAIELVTFPWTCTGDSSSTTAEQLKQEDKFTAWSRTWKKVMSDVIKDIRS